MKIPILYTNHQIGPTYSFRFQKEKVLHTKCHWDGLLTTYAWTVLNLKKNIIYCRSIDTVSKIFLTLKDSLGPDAYFDKNKQADNILVEMYHKSSVSGPYRPISPYVKPFFAPQLCSQPWLVTALTPFHRVSRYDFSFNHVFSCSFNFLMAICSLC